MTLAEKLNKYGVSYETSPKGVSLEAEPEDESLFDENGVVTDSDLNAFLGHLAGGKLKAYVDDHPDRRAGLVCWVTHNGEKAWQDFEGRWFQS